MATYGGQVPIKDVAARDIGAGDVVDSTTLKRSGSSARCTSTAGSCWNCGRLVCRFERPFASACGGQAGKSPGHGRGVSSTESQVRARQPIF